MEKYILHTNEETSDNVAFFQILFTWYNLYFNNSKKDILNEHSEKFNTLLWLCDHQVHKVVER